MLPLLCLLLLLFSVPQPCTPACPPSTYTPLCLPCPQQCLTCSQSSQCLTCQPGSSPLPSPTARVLGTCLQCAPQCLTCTLTPNNCTSCTDVHVLIDGSCIKDSSIGVQCMNAQILSRMDHRPIAYSDNGYKYCTGCRLGYYSWNNTCHACPSTVLTCHHNKTALYNQLIVNKLIPLLSEEYGLYPGVLQLLQMVSQWQVERGVELGLWIEGRGVGRGELVGRMQAWGFVRVYGRGLVWQMTGRLEEGLVDEGVLVERLVLQCRTGEYLAGHACRRCPQRCLDCNSTHCLQCSPAHLWHPTLLLCQPCHPACLYCTPSLCTQCHPGHYLSFGQCIANPQCLTFQYTPTLACLTCARPFSLHPEPSTHSCYTCIDPHCLQCPFNVPSNCTLCPSGFALSNGKCRQCQAQCLSCTVAPNNNTTICLQCSPTHALIQNQCVKCGIVGCRRCSPRNLSLCFQCERGYWRDGGNGCVGCGRGCRDCEEGVCVEVEPGFRVGNGSVLSCGEGCRGCGDSGCEECEDGYYRDRELGECRRCGFGCGFCIGLDRCLVCLSSAYLVGSQCQPLCSPPCLTCSCRPPQLPCPLCTSCPPGLYPSPSMTCLSCPSPCLTCTSPLDCTSCPVGFAISNGTCRRCLGNCAKCDGRDISKCMLPFEQGESECGVGCEECTRAGCVQCAKGYYVQGGACWKQCRFPCARCDNDTCFICIDKYSLENDTCIPATNCSGQSCFCPPGTLKLPPSDSSNIYPCVPCPQNCSTCHPVPGSNPVQVGNCLSCLPRYFFNTSSSTCQACKEECLQCTLADVCILCIEGYVLMQGFNNCTKCSQGCTACRGRPGDCQGCAQGYVLKGSQCIGAYTLGFELVFESSAKQFLMTDKLDILVQKLAEIIIINKDQIIITDVVSGSTVIKGLASAQNYSHADVIGSRLGAALAANPNIFGSGFMRGQWQVNYYGRLAPKPKNQYIQQPVQQVKTRLPIQWILIGSIGGTVILLTLGGALVCYLRRRLLKNRIFSLKSFYFENESTGRQFPFPTKFDRNSIQVLQQF